MPLSRSYIKELNREIAYWTHLYERGDITQDKYLSERAILIRDYYMKYYDEEKNCLLDYEKDTEPKGLVGIALRVLRKLF